MKKISVIVPCYNEMDGILEFYLRMQAVQKKLSKCKLELCFVDDGSTDQTLSIIKKFKDVKYVSFSRNFGKEAAMYAGLKIATGDYAVIIDADLQHDPLLIIDMYNKLEEGIYNSAVVRIANKKGTIKSFCSKIFYKFFSWITGIKLISGETDYRMMNNRMYQAVLSLEETNRFSKGIFNWIGFRTFELQQNDIKRTTGRSKWSLIKLFSYAIDGIISFSIKPLLLPIILSILLFIFLVLLLIIGNFMISVKGLILIVTIIGIFQFIVLGIISIYVGNIHIQSKKRPMYIIKEEKLK